jgi:hypothetical protein
MLVHEEPGMNKLNQLHWPLIMGLAALGLIRPVMNVTGLTEALGRPFGPILITMLISLAWLAIVVLVSIRDVMLTLVFTGISSGVFAILLSAIVSPILAGQLSSPITNPVAIISVLLTDAIWGALVGLCALALQALARPRHR